MADLWSQGYACAVACIVKAHGPSTETREALEANGMTSMAVLKEMGVNQYDQDILRPLVEEIGKKMAAHEDNQHG